MAHGGSWKTKRIGAGVLRMHVVHLLAFQHGGWTGFGIFWHVGMFPKTCHPPAIHLPSICHPPAFGPCVLVDGGEPKGFAPPEKISAEFPVTFPTEFPHQNCHNLGIFGVSWGIRGIPSLWNKAYRVPGYGSEMVRIRIPQNHPKPGMVPTTSKICALQSAVCPAGLPPGGPTCGKVRSCIPQQWCSSQNQWSPDGQHAAAGRMVKKTIKNYYISMV